MLDISFFINGGTVDNRHITRQWQLCQEAMNTHTWLESLDCPPSIFKEVQANGLWDKAGERLQRRLNEMLLLINAWNNASKIIEEQGERLRHAVNIAKRLQEAGLGEYAGIPVEELPF